MRDQRNTSTTSSRLALIGVLGVLVVMALALVVFNVSERLHLKSESEASVDEALGWQATGNAPATRLVTILYVDGDWKPIQMDDEQYTDLDFQVISWCANNRTLDVVQQAEFPNATCFVETSDNIYARGGHRSENRYAIAYADVTPQLSLIATITFEFVIIAVIGAACVGIAGWHAGKRIEAAQEAQKRFYENMSHELKTPLAAIRGYSDGITAHVMEPEESARAISRETDRMTRLVEQILDISRLEAGVVPLELEYIELTDLVQDTLMPFEGMARTRELDVELDVPYNVQVNVDVDLFGHALENVLSNAFRHASSTIRIYYDDAGLEIWNDGIMPAQEEVDHLFDRYRTGAGGSTGIGLALAKEVVSLHGWDISAKLHDGGMLFTFVLPESLENRK